MSASCVAQLIERVADDARRSPSEHIVTVQGEGGVELRGVFVPARGVRRGTVVHFLPRGASIRSGLPGGLVGVTHVLSLYADAGFDGWLFDYRGVGMSHGEPDIARLGADACAVVDAARAPDAPLLLRGTSLGTLAIAEVLAAGVPVDGVVLCAPVRASTVVDRAARRRYGAFFGAIAAAFVRAPAVADLFDVIGRSRAFLVVLPEHDDFLSPEDCAALQPAVAGNQTLHVVADADHEHVVLRAFGFELHDNGGRRLEALAPEERAWLEAVVDRR